MDILAGMLAYIAGLGALFGALAVAFFVFFAGPKDALQTQAQPPSAMLVRPSTANKIEARAKHGHSASHATAASSPAPTQPPSHEARRKPAAPVAQARRLMQEERARHWAYQQDSNFDHRFLGYSD
jgi:type IV secretory pathway VirB10-like protein